MTQTAYTVSTPQGDTKLLVMDRKEGFPATFALMATTALDKVVLRISGGCKGMNADDKRVMLDYFARGMPSFNGMIWSGSTRQFTKDDELDPMVTDVPGVIAAAYPGCVALGSAPRTDVLRLVGESRLVLDKYGTGPNPTMSGILIVQNGADGKLLDGKGEVDWGGDLNAAFELMDNLVNCAGFRRAGIIAWNGGPITRDEIMRSASRVFCGVKVMPDFITLGLPLATGAPGIKKVTSIIYVRENQGARCTLPLRVLDHQQAVR